MGNWNRRRQKPDHIEYDPAKAQAGGYTKTELEVIADQMLREAANEIEPETGKKRGLKGDDPILFYEHLRQRRRREIHSSSGSIDPSVVSGLYWRAAPDGRRVNSVEARAKGAAYFAD